jgi:hypothetical protein
MTIEIDDAMVGGERLGPPLVAVRAYPPRRVCAHEGCKTVLSIYNSGTCCATHDFRVEMPPAGTRTPRATTHVFHGHRVRLAA